jgi:hypothetical protein
MGIFQTIDYVGVDICANIMHIMSVFLLDPALSSQLLEQYLAAGMKGGQHVDGTQKKGFFSYDTHKIEGVYSLHQNRYLPIKDFALEKLLVPLPYDLSWRTLQNDPNKKEKISNSLAILFDSNTLGGQLAHQFLSHSLKTEKLLVEMGVADSLKDVDTVLKNGFFHLYGSAEIPNRSEIEV